MLTVSRAFLCGFQSSFQVYQHSDIFPEKTSRVFPLGVHSQLAKEMYLSISKTNTVLNEAKGSVIFILWNFLWISKIPSLSNQRSRKGQGEFYLIKHLHVQVRILLICNKQSSNFPKAVLFSTAVWVTIHVTVMFVQKQQCNCTAGHLVLVYRHFCSIIFMKFPKKCWSVFDRSGCYSLPKEHTAQCMLSAWSLWILVISVRSKQEQH